MASSRKFVGIGRRKKLVVTVILIILFCVSIRWFVYVCTRVSNEEGLVHFRRERNLSRYLNNINLLTEPSSSPCDGLETVPLLVLVASAPSRRRHRDAARASWAKHLPTYFILGLSGQEGDLVRNVKIHLGSVEVEKVYLEAKQYDDLIVYDLQEHYQNLTLKTSLMLKWSSSRCPSAGTLLKTDDDVLVNPWIVSNVLKENTKLQLLGYRRSDVWAIRDEYHKWYLPKWLFREDVVPQYLMGAAYFINGKYIKKILEAASEVPLINIEDIYFTYLVANKSLGLELTHDPRMRPYMTIYWLQLPCVLWPYAVNHGLSPDDMVRLWKGLVHIQRNLENKIDVCNFKGSLLNLFRP